MKKSLKPKALQPIAKLNFVSEIGELSLCANESGLSHLNIIPQSGDEWLSREVSDAAILTADDNLALDTANRHLLQARRELEEYFNGLRRQFEVKLAPNGTEFQRQVWQALSELDYGVSCSYAQIAERINRPKAVRAVGTANGANPIAIIVPCHRVIGKNGTLTGYAFGIMLKQKLLKLEGWNNF
ncbi:methylated-DNA--[protein]-cysteine S-methyltransferase [Shewanella schlegeliana]|uniref:Methylated-DNA--protein-cysteine methyltransferase n=1 Tax=Shewanella schlegeliana TaxID=190308 RepID=A0ABS1SUH9_9GAMM|nr:methylated-DNA--[protein]-cysteine S-methyltransferase [Shewanella schlegeliana]MBL4911675.1 methylated-DNA--[protein]-cysteine S-methyltransferase [Shewanella schlegeliana]MCL1110373.1 methylated-DNA--[protein]-cysteine S-methyltransferase [Shewanella schlegeliana]GIU31207.1 methylated-DNA--protein-cysteine methyltransferase [Shewanella schlegeliana]